MGTSNLAAAAYLTLLLVASGAADVGEDYVDYPYSDLELSIQPSGLDSITDADPDETNHEFRLVDYKSVPKLATVRDDDGLMFRFKPLSPSIIRQRTNMSRADRGLRQTTVVKKRGGVPYWYASDFGSTYTYLIISHYQFLRAHLYTIVRSPPNKKIKIL